MLHEDCPQLTQQAAKIDPVPHTAGTARNMRLALLATQRQMECLVRQEAQQVLQRMRDRQVRREKAATVLQVCLSLNSILHQTALRPICCTFPCCQTDPNPP
jgi:hypothetical protein